MPVTITRHAKERYAERIMERDSRTDAAVFIREHEDKIQRDIEKMIEYGTILYEGPTSKDPKRSVAVIINGSWVVLLDSKESTVITLYCVDLGVGEDANRVFIQNAISRINEAQEEYERTVSRTKDFAADLNDRIASSQAELEIHRKLCRDLEAKINGCRQMIIAVNADNEAAMDKIRERVEILIGRQRF